MDLELHLNSAECQVALRWWLGLDTSGGSLCLHCPDIALDPLGHHAASCRHGSDVFATCKAQSLAGRVAESQAGVQPVTGRPERPGLPGRIN